MCTSSGDKAVMLMLIVQDCFTTDTIRKPTLRNTWQLALDHMQAHKKWLERGQEICQEISRINIQQRITKYFLKEKYNGNCLWSTGQRQTKYHSVRVYISFFSLKQLSLNILSLDDDMHRGVAYMVMRARMPIAILHVGCWLGVNCTVYVL